jgi:hypothetical protein
MSAGATRKRDPAPAFAGALKARPLIGRVSRTLVERASIRIPDQEGFARRRNDDVCRCKLAGNDCRTAHPNAEAVKLVLLDNDVSFDIK